MSCSNLTGHIADTRDAAREAAITAIESGSLCIFSDGSGFKGGIGAAAVAIGGTTRTSYEEYMRLRPHSNTEGEEDIDGRTVDPASAYTQNPPFLSSFSSSHSHSLTFSFSHSNISIPLLSTTLSNPGHPMSTVPETRSPNVRRLHLGSDRDHTVFEAEVCGAILGLDLIRATPRATRATLFIDCQAAISAIKQPKKPNMVSIYWTPSGTSSSASGRLVKPFVSTFTGSLDTRTSVRTNGWILRPKPQLKTPTTISSDASGHSPDPSPPALPLS